jgi:hypothetical protein
MCWLAYGAKGRDGRSTRTGKYGANERKAREGLLEQQSREGSVEYEASLRRNLVRNRVSFAKLGPELVTHSLKGREYRQRQSRDLDCAPHNVGEYKDGHA